MADLYTPEHLKRWEAGAGASSWDSGANYCGADLSAFYLAPIHKTRDTADALTLSNWRVIERDLDQLAQHDETGATTIGHWACGWYEIYLIHETDTVALQAADQWAASLEQYPVADEEDWSELESEEEQEAWENWARSDWRAAVEKVLQTFAPDDADCYWADELLDTVEDAALDELWVDLSGQLGWAVEHVSDGPSFNFEGAAELLTVADLSALVGLALVAPDQRWRTEPYSWPDGSADPLVVAANV